MMIKKIIFGMLMGVLAFQSCTKYRISVTETTPRNYYYPQKRVLLSWEDLLPVYGNDLSAAKRTIDADRSKKIKNKKYINY